MVLVKGIFVFGEKGSYFTVCDLVFHAAKNSVNENASPLIYLKQSPTVSLFP